MYLKTIPYRYIKRMFWDGPCPSLEEWRELIEGRRAEWNGCTRRAALAKILERWSWEEISDYARDLIPDLLEEETLARVNILPIRTKYERLGKFLSHQPLSLPGWGDPNHADTEHTVFSNGRHGAGEGLSWA